MSKHKVLTEEEFSTFFPNKTLLYYIKVYRKRRNLNKEEMNILDWGCGKGKNTLWLREQGYNAYGVDIDIEPIRNGIKLFKAKGYDDSTLQLLSVKGITGFPDNFFHFTFSDQVFEHVQNLEETVVELSRITTKGGVGYHVYPAHRHIVEAHLHMPFVHWLPKNKLRKYFILAHLYFKIDPGWEELKNLSIKSKAYEYYQYSKNKTFYRKPGTVRSLFEKCGFRVNFEAIAQPKLVEKKFLTKLASFRLLKPIFDHFVFTFKSAKLFIRKL